MINPAVVAQIKACEGVYSLSDTARFFNVAKATVHRIWSGQRHTDVPEAPEPPNVISTRVSPDIIRSDAQVLLERHNGNVRKAAVDIGVHPSTLYRYINERNAGLHLS